MWEPVDLLVAGGGLLSAGLTSIDPEEEALAEVLTLWAELSVWFILL